MLRAAVVRHQDRNKMILSSVITALLIAALSAFQVMAQDRTNDTRIQLSRRQFLVASGPIKNDEGQEYNIGDKCNGRFDDDGIVLSTIDDITRIKYETRNNTLGHNICPKGAILVLSRTEIDKVQEDRLRKGRKDDAEFRLVQPNESVRIIYHE